MTEAVWIESARHGDSRAFGKLVTEYQRPVFSLAYRMLGRPEDAEDAAQEAFLKAFRALGSYDARRPFSTWLLSITAHHCIDRLRRRRVQEISLDGLPAWRSVPAKTVDPLRGAVNSERAARMETMLAQLSDQDRLVVLLRYWHDLGYSEIADVTGNSVSSVKSRLHRARRQLAERLTSEIDGDQAAVPAGGDHRARAKEAPNTGGMMSCRALIPVG